MSVPNQTPYIIYTANGLTTVFPFEFYIISASDIQVTINGTVVTTGYTVSGTGNTGGGDVTFLTPPANGVTVMLERVVPTYRLTDYQDNGDLLADTVNKDFDRLWMAIQRYGIHLGLALRRPLFGGPFNAEGYRISGLANPIDDQDAATKKYVKEQRAAARDEYDERYYNVTGDALKGPMQVGGNRITGLASPVDLTSPVRKRDLDAEISARQAADAALQAQLNGTNPPMGSAFSPISWHDQTITGSINIPANKNAWSFGPTITIAPGQSVTVGAGSFWTVANGQVQP